MTTTTRRGRTTDKTAAEPVVQETENTEVETPVVEAKTETIAEKRVLKETDKIPVMNNTTGRYGYRSKSGYAFDLEEYGDIAQIPLSEIRIMLSSQKRHIADAFIIILDEDVVEEINYTKEYKRILKTEQVKELLRNPDNLKEILPQMPKSMKEVVVLIAKQLYSEGKLNDIRIVNILKDELHLDIMGQ